MNIFILKLVLAPIILGGASLASRRWGPAVSGWLIGLPLTSGPVALFVALSHDSTFAASTALGTLSGGIALVVFCLAYTWTAATFGWQMSICASMLGYTAVTIVMQNLVLPLWAIFPLVVLAILAGLRLMPDQTKLAQMETKPGKWDLPVRILIGTSFILGLTGIAPLIGPRLTGLLSTIPLYPAGAGSVLRGLLFGMFGFAGFYLVLGLLLERAGIVPSFIAAIATTLIIQGISLLVMRRYHLSLEGG
jgi:hypothetical protein